MKQMCKIWPHSLDKDGYGIVKIKGKNRRVHRVALEIKIGRRLKRNEFATHLCHTRSCYNKEHLEVGDAKSNAQDTEKTRKSQAAALLPGFEKLYK